MAGTLPVVTYSDERGSRCFQDNSGIEKAPTYGMFRGAGIRKRDADQRIGTSGLGRRIAGPLPAFQLRANGLLWA